MTAPSAQGHIMSRLRQSGIPIPSDRLASESFSELDLPKEIAESRLSTALADIGCATLEMQEDIDGNREYRWV